MGHFVVLGVCIIFSLSCMVMGGTPFYPYTYCQAPNTLVPTTVNLKLELVQTITRHGDRTTLTALPDDAPFDCNLTTYMLPSLSSSKTASAPRLYRKNYLNNREVLPGNCNFGQLTSKGFNQHVALGSNLRGLYVDKYNFLSSEINTTDLWIRSTDIYRTVQSAQANLLGLYPSDAAQATDIPVVDMYTMDSDGENMYSNDELCPRGAQLEEQITNEPDFQLYEEKQAPLKASIAKSLGVTVDQVPKWGDLFDAFNVRDCYNLTFPKGITRDQINQVYANANWEYNYKLARPELVKDWIGAFIGELIARIQDKIEGKLIPKYLMYSGHDTTIAPLMTAFGAYDGFWPPYASHSQIELWSSADGSYFVQVKYQGIPRTLPNCGPDAFCPLARLVGNLKPYLFSNFKQECAAH